MPNSSHSPTQTDTSPAQKTQWLSRLRRFALLQVLFFAFGGFLFYAGVVVPIGSDVTDTTTQGFVTQRVTRILNIANTVAVVMLSWELWASAATSRRRSLTVMTICTMLIAVCTAALFWLHLQLDALVVPIDMEVVDHELFYQRHRLYLWTSTVLWLATLPIVWVFANRSAN